MKKLVNLSLVTASAILIIGCGSSSSSVDTATAYYLDSAVSGVNYKCGSQEGITGAKGEFTFEKGKSCTFYLGDIKLRDMDKVLLKDGAKIVEDDIKIATLLQSLDVDGNPDNGITLTPEVVEVVSTTLKEDAESKLPSTIAEVEALVASVENNVTKFEGHIVTEEEAQSHLESTQTKTLLAGKTFYLAYIDHDVQKIEKIVVNADATSVSWTMIKGESGSGAETIKISGKSFITGDEEHIIKNVTDKYIEVLTKDNDGDDLNRLYYSQAEAQAYLDSLGGGDKNNQTEETKALLAGKTFYTVDEADDGSQQVIELTFNDDVTSIKAVSPKETREWGILIDSNKLVFSDDTDGSYTLISQADGYIYFDDRNADGSKDDLGHRFYVNKADAQAYLDSITKEVTFSGHVIFKNSDGDTISKPEKAKIEISPSEDIRHPKVEIEIKSDGSFETTVRVLKELFDSDSSFSFVVYGDTNDNNNWDGDSGEVNHNGILENDIFYYDNDITFNDLNSIEVIID